MQILIIDDHRLFSDGLKLVINGMDDRNSFNIDQASNAQRALDLINSSKQYDLILTDLEMPGISGHEFLQSLLSRNISACVGVVSASNSSSDMQQAYRLGARGYICKSEPAFEMQKKLTALLEGKLCFPDELENKLRNEPAEQTQKVQELGRRPIQVLELLAQGKSNKQIASILNITETTVKFHVRILFDKLGVNNRTSCVREAHRNGFLNSDAD